jgi:hypothetical protein
MLCISVLYCCISVSLYLCILSAPHPIFVKCTCSCTQPSHISYIVESTVAFPRNRSQREGAHKPIGLPSILIIPRDLISSLSHCLLPVSFSLTKQIYHPLLLDAIPHDCDPPALLRRARAGRHHVSEEYQVDTLQGGLRRPGKSQRNPRSSAVPHGFADKARQNLTQTAAHRVLSHPDLLRHIMSFAVDEYSECDKATLANCVRVNSAFFDAAGYHLYRRIVMGKDHLEDDAYLSHGNGPKPDRPFKGGLLRYTKVFTWKDHYSHQCRLFCNMPAMMPNLQVLCVKDSGGGVRDRRLLITARKSIPPNPSSSQHSLTNSDGRRHGKIKFQKDDKICPILNSLRPHRLVLQRWYNVQSALALVAKFQWRTKYHIPAVTMIHRSKDTLPQPLPRSIMIRHLIIAIDSSLSRLWPPPRPKAVFTHFATICIRNTGQVTFANPETLEPEQLGDLPPNVSPREHFESGLRSMIDQLTESETDEYREPIHERVSVMAMEGYLASHDWEGEFDPEDLDL